MNFNMEASVKLALSAAARVFYRIRVIGADNVPKTGPALLVSNHVSFIDAILIAIASPRNVRFLMFRAYYDMPVARHFFKAMGVIPISGQDSPKSMIESLLRARSALEAGDMVCIFAEGEISRHGQMLRFKKGFEKIVEKITVPVVPVHLDHLWGSLFSFEGGRVFFKRPRRLPYPLTVSFGTTRPSSSDASEIRQAVMDLGAAAFHHRLEESLPLPLAFAREARRHPLRMALADSTGVALNYGLALGKAFVLGEALRRALHGRESAGIFLPPSAGGALANLGLSLHGVIPVNLSYTVSQDILSACLAKASLDHLVTSRRFLESLGWQPPGKLIFLEDITGGIPARVAAAAALKLLSLPWKILERGMLARAAGTLDRTATVLFTSGSTGIPKGVMLTHANILSNIEAIGQIFPVAPSDRMLGILPFHHAFGLTCTLWFPLLSGLGAVYHTNPLEAERVGDMAEKFSATILLATPTLLLQFIRRVTPKKFESLRQVMAGSETLRDSVAEAFEARFGVMPLEGYGCTELSPVAAVNIPDLAGPGVRQRGGKRGSIGHPLPGVALRIVNPESGEPLAPGKPGLLLVRGPNVMKGYLGDPELTAEAIRNGYYVTGDLATLDEDGFVTIIGRLSRFSKIAGEMVPQVLIEEKLQELSQNIDQAFAVTSVADLKRGERLVVFFKGKHDAGELRRKLIEAGLPKLWIPDEACFFSVGEFPLSGPGKIDLRRLKTLALEKTGPLKAL